MDNAYHLLDTNITSYQWNILIATEDHSKSLAACSLNTNMLKAIPNLSPPKSALHVCIFVCVKPSKGGGSSQTCLIHIYICTTKYTREMLNHNDGGTRQVKLCMLCGKESKKARRRWFTQRRQWRMTQGNNEVSVDATNRRNDVFAIVQWQVCMHSILVIPLLYSLASFSLLFPLFPFFFLTHHPHLVNFLIP